MTEPTSNTRPRPVVLCVLDGWGWREERDYNAIAQGNTPNFDRLWNGGPHGFLDASEEKVGLPSGQMGNSEVGHMNLGAGRIVMQDLPMIDKAVADDELPANEAIIAHIAALKESGGTSHIMGLLSPGGVHSHQDHIAALARALSQAGVPVAIHAFTDGRDTPPRAAKEYLIRFLDSIAGLPNTRIGVVSGRYWAMDRDKRWDRVEIAYRALTDAAAPRVADPVAAIQASYDADVGDEFIKPVVVGDYAGMKDGDGVLFANFRADRARELLGALLDPEFNAFPRQPIAFADAAGMVEYSERLNGLMSAIFPPKTLTNVLGEVIAKRGLLQLRIAETEKYPHVTFFFNGGEERQFPGEDRILVQSPKVATYDLKPEMSAHEVTDKLVAAIDSGKYDLVIANYANPDMVGHTGFLDAAIKAIETVDICLGRVEQAVRRQGGVMLVTADHGNAEQLLDPENGGPHTAHTLNIVPAFLVNAPSTVQRLRNGRLADVAPTLLELMGLPKPAEMTGASLLELTGGAARKAAE